MSKQRWGRDELVRFTLFLVLIALGWIGLSWAGYTENPMESMHSLIEVYQILQLDPSTVLPESSGSVGLFTDFDWSAFPDVLYNIWFICLITAVVILINRLVVYVTKYFKTNS